MTAAAYHALSGRARALRETFDATFARPPAPPPPPATALLLMRVGGESIAVRHAEMTGLTRVENFVAAPGRSPAFLGFAGVRGELHPVWCLARLLGRAPAPNLAGGWLVLAAERADAPCAFVCETFEQLVFVTEADFSASALDGASPGPVRARLPGTSTLVPVVSLPALQAEIHKRKEPIPSRTSPP